MTTVRTISSQRYLDHEIVEGKRRHRDYVAQRVLIAIDGERLWVVVDGHHSLRAAALDNAGVVWETPEAVQAIARSVEAQGPEAVQAWFAELQGDSDWYDVATGRDAW